MAEHIDLSEMLDNVNQEALEGWEEFDEQLRQLSKRDLTKDEIRAQKISFIMSMLPPGSTMTREEVAASIDNNPYS